MCGHCGCAKGSEVTITSLAGDAGQPAHHHHHGHGHGGLHHHHHHGHEHDHAHVHLPADPATVELGQAVLAKNDALAAANRAWFEARGILALNLVSSPGAGKTALLERTIADLGAELAISVIEGDQETLHDAERIRATGARSVQINTGTGCHLEAAMLARGLDLLAPPAHSVVMIENVGNMVCPSMFDLGEQAKVAILSITEGEDKPVKYPHMIRAATVLLLNKIDLLPFVRFDVERCLGFAREVNQDLRIFQISATTGAGLGSWYGWLRAMAGRAVAPKGRAGVGGG
jgi:hydrogenase nickel incorporation protein HypB